MHNETLLKGYISRKALRLSGFRQKEKHGSFVSKLPCLFGAGGGVRTHTLSPGLDFESSTSANSITPAIRNDCIISQKAARCKCQMPVFSTARFPETPQSK